MIPSAKAGLISKAATKAPAITESHDATKTHGMKRLLPEEPLVNSLIRKKLNPPITAMLNAFMPNASMPPSAKKNACINKTIVMLSMAAYGPSSTARKVPPTRWPLVPKAIGKLIICAANTKALDMASKAVMEWE